MFFDNNGFWISRLPGDQSISAISLPGTHDSCARIGLGAQCQNMSLPEQLLAGIRFLDIRCRLINDTLAIHHGVYYQNMAFGDVQEQCVEFLQNHPNEFILMSVRDEYEQESSIQTFEKTLETYIKQNPDYWYTSTRIPQLSEARGKMVLVRRFDGIIGLNWNSLVIQDDYEVPAKPVPLSSNFVPDIEWKWNKMVRLFDKAQAAPGADTLYVNFASGYWLNPNTLIPDVQGISSGINPKVRDYFSNITRFNWACVVPMDFPDAAEITAIIGQCDARFGLMPGQWVSHWSGGWTTIVPFSMNGVSGPNYVCGNGPVYLFEYKSGDGDVCIDRVNENKGGVTAQWHGKWSGGWTSISPFYKNGHTWLIEYKSGNGEVCIDRVNDNLQGVTGQWTGKWSGGWTTIAPFYMNGNVYLIEYKKGDGEICIDRIQDDVKGVEKVWSGKWSGGWTTLVPFYMDGRVYLFEYKAGDGDVCIDQIRSDAKGVDKVWSSKWSGGWTNIVPFYANGNVYLFEYKNKDGEVNIDRVNSGANGVTRVWSGKWSGGWTTTEPFYVQGVPFLFEYKKDPGTVTIECVVGGVG